MKHSKKLVTLSVLTTMSGAAIYFLNKTLDTAAVRKNLLASAEKESFSWQFGDIFYTKKGTGTPMLLLHDLHCASSGREWQCGTVQMDMNLPQRFDISYIGEDGEKHQPVMLHRALFGSIERFLGILIENHAGKLPLWLSPEQVVVCPIVSDIDDYAEEVVKKLQEAGLYAKSDLRNEKINYKVREHSLAKVPVIAVVGAKEKENGTVTVRRLGSEKQETVKLDDFVAALVKEAQMPHLHE